MKTSQDHKTKSRPGRKRRFQPYMQEKLAVVFIVVILVLSALIYVLYHLVDEKQDIYNQIVLSQQEYDSRTIPYRRGDIVDRNGTYLATTEKVFNLIIDPKQIMSDEENYLSPSITALCTVFGYDPAEIRRLITENRETAYIRYARQLSHDQKEAFEKYQEDTNRANQKDGSRERIRGVWFEDEYRRIYPYDSLAASVIGFASSDGSSGNGGIEQSYNRSLIGDNGREYGYLNDDSNLERVIKPAENGSTIVSTLDVNIQNAVEKRIAEWMRDTGSEHVGVVVMDPNNGEVLAMADEQVFNLNDPRNIAGKFTDDEIYQFGLKEAADAYKREHKNTDGVLITPEEVPAHYSAEEIQSYGTQVAWNKVWRNYCISDTYEPGSPSKIFTVAAALEEGLMTPNSSFFCDGYQEAGGHLIKCTAYRKGGHQNVSLAESLMVSCNDAMMQIAAATGGERFGKYQQMFGFGAKTGIDLPGEADAANLIYRGNDLRSSNLATNSFGQNYNCTMIQMAAAYCSVINGGSYYEPHVVKQVRNEHGAVEKQMKPRLVRETVSESTSSFIKDALLRTVNEGTGGAAAVAGYDIAGKTGTAEKYPRQAKNYLVSFCGFAPAHDPQVLVYVTIDTPHVEDQPHSTFASTVFSKIMGDILPYLNVFPAVDYGADPEQLSSQLPEAEGITDNSGSKMKPTETKVYETEEYIKTGSDDELSEDEYPAGDMMDRQQESVEITIDLPISSEEKEESSIAETEVPETTRSAETTKKAKMESETSEVTKAADHAKPKETKPAKQPETTAALEGTRHAESANAETAGKPTETIGQALGGDGSAAETDGEAGGEAAQGPVGNQPGTERIILPHP